MNPLVYKNFNGNISLVTSTGESFSYEEFYNKFNTTKVKTEFYEINFEGFDSLVNKTHLRHFNKPFMLFTTCFEIPQFSVLKFDVDTVNLLNKEGLHIFLTELVVKYKGPRNYINKSNLSKQLLDSIEFSNARFEYDPTVKVCEFDSIQDLATNNLLTNVHVYTVEDNVRETLGHNYPNINFHCQDLFLQEKAEFIYDNETLSSDIITTKFLCTNWRYSFHRHLAIAYLIGLDGKYSWYYTGSLDKLNNNLWFDIHQWRTSEPEIFNRIETGIAKINTMSPIALDVQVDSSTEINGSLSDLLLLPTFKTKPRYTKTNQFEGVFCPVIAECEYAEPTANFSEKTLLAIKHKKPFIIVGQPNTLKYLKKFGFKTFSEFWDESYDSELNHEQRFIKLFKLINYVDQFTLDELTDLHKQMLPTLTHNLNVLNDLYKKEEWPIL